MFIRVAVCQQLVLFPNTAPTCHIPKRPFRGGHHLKGEAAWRGPPACPFCGSTPCRLVTPEHGAASRVPVKDQLHSDHDLRSVAVYSDKRSTFSKVKFGIK
jgi:hypothetical protein